jgi:hypothetical protein
VFDFVNNHGFLLLSESENQQFQLFQCLKKSESKNHNSDYFKTLKKPGSFFIYLEIVENSDYIWEIVSFVQGEECVYILLDFSYFYSSLFSHLECHGSIKLSFTNHLLVSKVRVTSKNVWLFDYHFSSVLRISFSTF